MVDAGQDNQPARDQRAEEFANLLGVEPGERVRRVAVSVAALAQSGLAYGESSYDLDRYAKLTKLAAELFSVLTAEPAATYRTQLARDTGYATPKVDVRGIVFDAQERVLLTHERSDGLWSLPGGWADPLDTPSVAVQREIFEETGYPSRAVRLIGCLDRDLQGHLPPMPVSVYKLLFLCAVTGEPQPPQDLETLGIGWFSTERLPPLSPGRVSSKQIHRALEHHRDGRLPVDFD